MSLYDVFPASRVSTLLRFCMSAFSQGHALELTNHSLARNCKIEHLCNLSFQNHLLLIYLFPCPIDNRNGKLTYCGSFKEMASSCLIQTEAFRNKSYTSKEMKAEILNYSLGWITVSRRTAEKRRAQDLFNTANAKSSASMCIISFFLNTRWQQKIADGVHTYNYSKLWDICGTELDTYFLTV